ncbi:MAG: PLP-dependent aspartate aminotransferase family protein [Rhodothermales bacterium]
MSHIETLLAQSGCVEDPTTGAVVAPVHFSTTFVRDADGSYPRGFSYSRENNPTRSLFEKTLAEIEGGVACAAFSSGMAAVTAVFQSLKPGDHVILPDDVYHGVRHVGHTIFSKWGLQISQIDLSNEQQLADAIKENTALIWIETPSNPLLKITDIAVVVHHAKSVNAQVVVDGAWTTPLLQRPLELGADLVLHSVTKYLAGHSDVLGGAIISRANNPFFDQIVEIQKSAGAVMDPFSAWLSLRGMRSLSARIQLQCANARKFASFLDSHQKIAKVHYPSLTNHKGHKIAKKQMSDFGGMLSLEVDGSSAFAKAIANNTKLFKQATSLGGTESLIEHRASIEVPPSKTPDTLLRLSIGLEHIDDLLMDLAQAIDKAVDA